MRYVRFLLGGSLLLVGTAHAQATFSFGPRAGLNIATAHYPNVSSDISHASRAGFEAGLTSNIQFGRFALQPSVLFSQKGYSEAGARTVDTARASTYKQQVRLNYLTVPLNLAFTLGPCRSGPASLCRALRELACRGPLCVAGAFHFLSGECSLRRRRLRQGKASQPDSRLYLPVFKTV
jgi:hypothetical protein